MPLNAINEPTVEFRRVDEDVEVLVDGRWCFGMLAEWRRYTSLGWTGWVRYHGGPGENRIGTFLAKDIRRAAGHTDGPVGFPE